MKIDLMSLLDMLAVVFAIIFGITTNARQTKKDLVERAVENAKQNVLLERIETTTNDIKQDFKDLRTEVQKLDQRVTIVECKADKAHSRIDGLLGKDE